MWRFLVLHRLRDTQRQSWISGIAVGALVGTAVAATMHTLRTPEFVAEAAFSPQTARRGSSLGALVSQLGLAGAASDVGLPVSFYADVLLSRVVLLRVLRDSATVEGSRRSLGESLVPRDGLSELEWEDRAYRRLRRLVTASPSIRTGMVKMRVTSSKPELSLALAEGVLRSISDFSVQNRIVVARAESEFIENTLKDAERDLWRAEDTLASFTRVNRDVRYSPELALRLDRLQRVVGARRRIYDALTESAAQARVEAGRDTPVLSVIEPPSRPVRESGLALLVKVVLGVLGGGAVGLLWVATPRGLLNFLRGDTEDVS